MTYSTTISVRWQDIYENACFYSKMSWKRKAGWCRLWHIKKSWSN